LRRKRLWIPIVTIAVVAGLAFVGRHAAGRVIVEQILSEASGYHVRVGELRLQTSHGAFLDVHVSKNGDPVLDADRVDLYYDLRELLPGSRHRFGFLGVSILRPRLTIVHHQDGSYNVTQGRPSGNAAPGQTRGAGTPLDYFARIRDGSAQLVDQYQYYKEARLHTIRHISADLSVKSDDRTHYVVTGAFVDVKDEPLRAVGTIDYHRGFALHRVVAAAVPIRAIANYFINSPAARMLAGTAKNLDARIYALDVQPGQPISYHVGARADIADAQLYVQGLALPLRRIRGVIRVFDGGLGARSLDATLAGVPFKVAGAIYNFSNPQFYFGVEGIAALSKLKAILAFTRGYPLSGSTQLQTLIEGPVSGPLVLIGFASALARYQSVPVQDLRGLAALYNNAVSIVPLRAKYGRIAVTVHGQLLLGRTVDSEIALHYAANANDVPYLGSLAPGRSIAGDAILRGRDQNIAASGELADAEHASALGAFYELTPRGYSTIGPIAISSQRGSLFGGLVVDRPRGDSAFWISADNFTLAPARAATFPGIKIPAIPALDGHLDQVNVAGGGSGSNVTLAGLIHARKTHVQGVPMDEVEAAIAGPLSNLSIARVRVRAPWGQFDGNGSYDRGGLIARGAYNGRLESLAQFVPLGAARGEAHGEVALAIGSSGVIVQAQDVRFSDAQIRGVPVQAVTGTIAVNGQAVRVYSASAKVAGASAVAAGRLVPDGGKLAVEMVDAGPQTAAALGLPLQSGRVAMAGVVGESANAPTFDGGVALSAGRIAGYPLAGSAEVQFGGSAVQLTNATVTLGGTYGSVAGTIGALRSGSPTYDLSAGVPAGDISSIAQTLRLPTFGTTGSFAADVRIAGRGGAPSVQGPVSVASGQINGLDFGSARTFLTADPYGVSAQAGRVVVGTTAASFDASARGSRSFVSLRAPRADLADFNDYFDTGDTLAGRGSVALAVTHRPRSIASSGNVSVRDFRYRRLPIGDTQASWSSRDNVARGQVRIGGEHGILVAAGSIALASGAGIADLISHSRYDLSARLRSLDLTTWLPAFGYPTVPVTGRIDADAAVSGRYPALGLRASADLKNGTIGRIPIDRLRLDARAARSRIALSQIDARIPALDVTGSGSFGLAKRDPIAFDVHAQSADLPTLFANFTRTPLGVAGSLETTLSVRGTFALPKITAGIDFSKGVVHGVAVPEFIGAVTYAGRDVILRGAELNLEKGQIAVAGALPLQLSPLQIGPPNAPFSVDFFSHGVNMSDFEALFPTGTKVSGLVDGRIGISGQVARPQIRGRLNFQNGSYVSTFETVPITQTVATLAFAGTSATLTGVHAQLGSGTLDASGRIAFDSGAAQGQVSYALDAVTKRAALHFPAYGSGTLDSKMHLEKRVGLARLSGDASVTDAVIPFATLINGGGGDQTAANAGALPFNLAFENFGVTAGRNVSVRANALGFGLDIGARGNAILAGTLAQPTLAGRFDASGGTLTFVDHAFKVREGYVVFNPSNGVVPDLYAIGTTHVLNPDPSAVRNASGSADITITVTGQATGPQLSFASNPPGYSRDQIIGMLTPLGAVTGIQFDEFGNPVPQGQLAGAPLPGNAQPLPPGAIMRTNGQITVGQEAFNILNAQFASSLFAPIENVLGGGLGLSDVNLTLDYSGAVGVNFRKPISERFYAVYATTFGYPSRQTYGFAFEPNPLTAAQLTFFTQQQAAGAFSNTSTLLSSNLSATAGQPLGGSSGFTFTIQRLFW